MADPDQRERLRRLEARIEAAKKAASGDERPHQKEHYSQAQLAWRMVIELVAGLGIGVAIGMGLDWLFGLQPLFLVVFTLLGFAAGVQTMLRSAREVSRRSEGTDGPDEDEGA